MTKSPELSIKCNHVKRLVDQRYDTIYQFWKASGMSRQTAYGLYNDPSLYPSERSLVTLCRLFRCSPNDVIEINLLPAPPRTQGLIDALERVQEAQQMDNRSFGYFLKAHGIEDVTKNAIYSDHLLQKDWVPMLKDFFKKYGFTNMEIKRLFQGVEIVELEVA